MIDGAYRIARREHVYAITQYEACTGGQDE